MAILYCKFRVFKPFPALRVLPIMSADTPACLWILLWKDSWWCVHCSLFFLCCLLRCVSSQNDVEQDDGTGEYIPSLQRVKIACSGLTYLRGSRAVEINEASERWEHRQICKFPCATMVVKCFSSPVECDSSRAEYGVLTLEMHGFMTSQPSTWITYACIVTCVGIYVCVRACVSVRGTSICVNPYSVCLHLTSHSLQHLRLKSRQGIGWFLALLFWFRSKHFSKFEKFPISGLLLIVACLLSVFTPWFGQYVLVKSVSVSR